MPEQLALLDREIDAADAERPPTLTLRISRRARRLFLQMVPPSTLEVVVPVGVGARTVQSFVAEHRDWILAARAELARHRPELPLWPKRVELAALGHAWQVDYAVSRDGRPRLADHGDRLVVRTAQDDHAGRGEMLRNWLLRLGRRHLVPWLGIEADRLQARFSRVQIRLQRTRWGSCSSQRNISLNAALLFAPRNQVRYLLVHELCHLSHMNHSDAYWRLVERFEPDWRRLDHALGAAWTGVPAWALARLR